MQPSAQRDAFAFQPGQNCWRVETTERFGVCVDGECYFAMLRASLIAARRCIAIAAWDIHSRVELVRPDPGDGWPTALGDLFVRLLETRPELEVFILLWDYAPIYLLEREPLFFGEAPWGKDSSKRHPRLHFIKDGHHPLMASQHQKLVVIDGALAYCGGFDLSKWRWDTNAHQADEPRRCDPDGDPYPPFHDLQVLVDGAAAIALGELFADRWERAGGGRPPVLQQADTSAPAQQRLHDPWPTGLEPLLEAMPVGIARTLPAFDGQPEARESEQLYLDMIRSAEKLLYIENQYLTSRRIAEALGESLEQPQGPEIILILPRETGHWLEQHTMDLIRARLLKGLRQADRYQRLQVLYPAVDGLGDASMMVHAKLMIADDRILRIGSSNLSNRSMGLDSECDLCIVADSEAAHNAVRQLRQQLLAMFLAVEPDLMAQLEVESGATARAIARIQDRKQSRETEAGSEAAHPDAAHSLEPLGDELDPEWDRQLPDERLIDPDQPLSPQLVSEVVVGEEHEPHARWRTWVGIAALLVFIALAAAWRWTPIGEWLQPAILAEAARALSDSIWGAPLAVALFVLASLAAVPVTLLILVTTLVFEPVSGALVALVSATLSAIAGYGIGGYTGARAVEKRLGGRLADLRQRLTQRGILAVVTLRIVPVAPFVVLNLVAGAMRVRFRDYVLGTVLGMSPAVIAMAFFAEGLLTLLGRSDMRSLALIVAMLLALVGVVWLGRWLAGADD
ncbi:VTT domain-containing protein [Halochromatium glycolicum]|uniref:Phosphatidylserine/phosphatidylglycerophosphate/ cardiolipin synthase n=1 Tax=Halochromatium glycolicum TaxID=85075 RepID=A0AAJ0X9Z0_9GAMM|nr:VTT domain-containing protein [Halochromatium glycolicum]MBK1705274.1 phosphatidylserine/phosphatidylglycerophosphate/cardiolipin synthase [Halochromatium glycolicum]